MLLTWILIGAFSGWLAGILTGSEDQGCTANIIVGMLGSLVGGALEKWLRTGNLQLSVEFTGFTLSSLVVSTLGAVLLLGILHIIRKLTK